jgi:hypothetical protein
MAEGTDKLTPKQRKDLKAALMAKHKSLRKCIQALAEVRRQDPKATVTYALLESTGTQLRRILRLSETDKRNGHLTAGWKEDLAKVLDDGEAVIARILQTDGIASSRSLLSENIVNDDVVGEALATISSLPEFAARDIATQKELYRLWQIDCAAYGERSITFEQFHAQWLAFPHFPKALFYQNDIAGAIGIMPTTETRMKDFAEGRIREADLQNDDLGQFMTGSVNVWLIDGIVRNPKYPRTATRELLCSSILSWIVDGLIRYPLNIYAIGQNRHGMNLITRAGFKLIKTAESLPDGMPFYVLSAESEAKLLRLLLERLRYYASITP